MNYIVLDLEWNQRLKGQDKITEPVRLRGEIIQIGAVKLDENYAVTDTFKIMISPVYYKVMHQMVSEITDITTKDLQHGLPFKVAFEQFKSWCGENFIFLVWGIDDLDMLCDNMQLHSIDTSCMPVTYNLQLAFDNQISKEHRQISLARAMDMVGEPALKYHDALNDALNTAHICTHLDMETALCGCEITRKIRKTKVRKKPKKKSKPLPQKPEKLYFSRKAALKDDEVTRFYCSEIGEEISCTGFVEQNSKKYMAIGKGKSGKEFIVKFSFIKWCEGEFSVSHTVNEMTEDRKASYQKRKKRAETIKRKYYNKIKKAIKD